MIRYLHLGFLCFGVVMGLSISRPASDGTSGAPSDVFIFFFVVLSINAVFVTLIAAEVLPKLLYPRGRFYLLGLVLVAVVFLLRGHRAVLKLFTPLLAWRFNPIWLVVAVLWPFFSAFVFVVVKTLITGSEWQLISPGIHLLTQQRLLGTIFIAALIGEIVWIGYAVRTLSLKFSKVTASLMTGMVWALWWLPMVYFQIGVIPGLSWFGLSMNMMGIALFCTFFYSITKSGLPILAMQFCYNCAVLTFPVMPKSGGLGTYEIYSLTYLLAGLFAVIVLLPRIQKIQARSADQSLLQA